MDSSKKHVLLPDIKDMRLHDRIVRAIRRRHCHVAEVLGVDDFYVKSVEYELFDGDRIDLVAQDKFDAYCILENTTCFVLEVKSKKANHEVLGQLKKAVITMEKIGRSIGHWHSVQGVCVAAEYTKSAIKLIKEENYVPLFWAKNKEDFYFFKAPC